MFYCRKRPVLAVSNESTRKYRAGRWKRHVSVQLSLAKFKIFSKFSCYNRLCIHFFSKFRLRFFTITTRSSGYHPSQSSFRTTTTHAQKNCIFRENRTINYVSVRFLKMDPVDQVSPQKRKGGRSCLPKVRQGQERVALQFLWVQLSDIFNGRFMKESRGWYDLKVGVFCCYVRRFRNDVIRIAQAMTATGTKINVRQLFQ